MPPPRRARDRLARALRATADRLSGPDPAEDVPPSPGQPPAPGQPPEHWRRLVAAHAPGLLRDLPPSPAPPPPADPPPPSASSPPSVERRQRDRWRWMARLINGLAASRTGPPRSWYERVPTGAVSYQDLPQVLEGGTGISGGGRSVGRLGRGAASTLADGGEGTAGSETFPPTVDTRCRSGEAARPDGALSRQDSPACGCVTSRGPAGSACLADGTGARDALGRAGTHGTPAIGTRTGTSTRAAETTATAGTRPAPAAGTGSAGSSDRTGTDRSTGSTDSFAGTGAPTSADRRTGPDGTRGATGRDVDHLGDRPGGSPGHVTSGGSAPPSAAERWPGLSEGRSDALRNLAQLRRSRSRKDAVEADLPPDRGDVPPLVFAAPPPSLPHQTAARMSGGRTGHANGRPGTGTGTGEGSAARHPARAAGAPYPHGSGPDRSGALRPTADGPWPALPDDTGPARTTNPAGAGRATGGEGHADPWPPLPAEPAWTAPRTTPRTTPWSDTARLDREQAGD